MKVLIVSGIWPPDVGGPASHAPEVAEFLRGRGHDVEVRDDGRRAPAPAAVPRALDLAAPAVARPLRCAARCSPRRGRGADVVYSTGMFGRTRVGALLGRAPRVVKLTGDPAYERALRYGLTTLPLDGVPALARPPASRAEGDARTATLCGAAALRLPQRVAAGDRRRLGLVPRRPDRRAAEPDRRARARRPRRAAPAPRLRGADARRSPAGCPRRSRSDVALDAVAAGARVSRS